MKKPKPCLEWPNCECPRCNAVRLRESGMGVLEAKDRTIAERILGECHYCGASATTKDHKTPKSKGGGSLGNVVPACRSCNQRKGSMGYEEFLALIGKRVS